MVPAKEVEESEDRLGHSDFGRLLMPENVPRTLFDENVLTCSVRPLVIGTEIIQEFPIVELPRRNWSV
jgi:hypothetical protein